MIGLALLAALATVASLTAPAGAHGKHHQKKHKGSKTKLSLSLPDVSQATLAGDDAIDVTVKAKGKRARKVWLIGTAGQGGKNSRISPRTTVKVPKNGTKTVSVPLSPRGSRLVQSCMDTEITVEGRYRAGGKKRSTDASGSMDRDPSRCTGSTPVGVDVADAAKCDPIAPIDSGECLFPYPNNYFTKADPSTPTGLQLDLKPTATPQNNHGVNVDPSEINTSDGFSPGAGAVIHIPGMDTPAAYAKTNPVPLTNMGEYTKANAPIVVIDAETGKRQLIWTELDSNATSPAGTDLLIHWGKNLLEGHRYIVAMRNIKDASGKTLDAPEGFRLYRDNIPTDIPAIEKRRGNMNNIFGKLKGAGVERSNLYIAWDFTVASTRNIAGRMLHIRNAGLAQLGDMTPGDGVIDGHAPNFTITGVKTATDGADPNADPELGNHAVENVREVTGTIQVPCFIHPDCEAPTAGQFAYDSNGNPTQATGAGKYYNARFTCNIPQSAVVHHSGGGNQDYDVVSPDRSAMYGHGLFGDYTEVHTKDVRSLGTDHGVITCGTDFIGMYEDDVLPEALPALQDMSKFTPLPDRLQQGYLDFVYLGRLLAAPDGLASDPSFQFHGGTSALSTNKGLFYYGNSQGGIAGGALTAIEPDITRTVLYVPGMNYSLLLTRSVDFGDYASILYPAYPDEGARPLLLSMIQSMWDRGEPDGYANHMTSHPLNGTPSHKVLIDMAYGDHQVANVSTEVEARTIGAPLRTPTLDAFRLPAGFDQPYFDMPPLGDLSGSAANGNGMFVWDIGPKRTESSVDYGTDPPPITNTAPDDSFGVDPHDTVIRQTPETRDQIATFLQRPVDGGKIIDPCGPHPCYAAGWTGP